ncbi:MAG: UDP-N-acetylmuramoyl-L-alanyl-D-glutamate--2,6-diaminopimelate ligase [Clostridia bacterium]|nr:UDP-N-acetylmuramoyl-L-alanyl-D-glutamate--2,6-diaminopimelate ligase [Clostridia bacterium]
MKLLELCTVLGRECPNGSEELEIASVEMDSRRVQAGSAFVCIRGLHTDGHAYIKDAIAAGAVCIIAEKGANASVREPILCLEVPDTRRALSVLCHAQYGYPSKKLKLIGVTGTNGKTSVTHILRAMLEASLCKCGLIGTVGCESAGRHLESGTLDPTANMTTPDPPVLYRMLAQMVEDGVEYVLMEVTSHALALGKLEPLSFEAAIFTNLTPEHLDFHKTMEAYADAKSELFQKSRLSVINVDSPYAARMRASAVGRVITCGTRGTGDYVAENVEICADGGVSYDLKSGNASIHLHCPVPGGFHVMNSMQAAIVAHELGFGMRAIKGVLNTLSGVRGRMERVRLGPGADFTVLIDYAHTPDALENLLRTAAQLRRREGRLILLFGCGGDRDRGKRPVMGRIASLGADYVILTSDNSRGERPEDIIEEILVGIDKEKPYTVIVDRRDAIFHAIAEARKDDIVLLAGKGHEEYEIDREGRRPFSEREIVSAAFTEKRRPKNDGEMTETRL